MKLLLDQGLPRGAVGTLRGSGFETVHASEVGMAAAADADILAYARREGRVIVTLDADFHALLATSNASSPSVVRIRIESLRADALAAMLVQVIAMCAADLTAGAMVSVDERGVRIRALPLLR